MDYASAQAHTEQKGFTLIELLIVIGILAILTAAVVIILNPGELLKQARDSQRFSDLDALKNAIALYLTDSQQLGSGAGTAVTGDCYATLSGTGSECGGRFTSSPTVVATPADPRPVTGAGWIPLNFNAITSGSPLQNLPIDPVNSGNLFYSAAFNTTNLTFELDAVLESTKYGSGAGSKAATDGGSSSTVYEVGSAPGLNL